MEQHDSQSDQPLVEPLTTREFEILTHLAEHRTNREIADLLVLSVNTVKWYARQIYDKLGVGNRRQAVARAWALGLLPASDSTAPRPHNLPAQVTTFLGRQRILMEIGRLLSGSRTRLLTIVGPGGIGKTRLAIAAATLVLEEDGDSFQDGIFYVSLARLSDPATIPAALARAIGFQFYQGEERQEQQLVQYLSNKRQLLVLDNFEHLIDGNSIQLLMDVLAAAGGIKLLVTSRSRLNVQGEHLIPLGGLEIPAPDEIGRRPDPVEWAQTFSGIQLFLRSARRLRPDFTLDPQSLMPSVRICSLVQGFPLGIELAASWVHVLEPHEIAAELAWSLDILETDARNVPERQQSLRAVFNASWELLTAEERQAVQRLSVFEDGFDREGAQGAAGVSLGTLAALVNKSWIEQVVGGRFQMHDLLCRYGREKLGRDPALEVAACDRHSHYYCDWLRQQGEGTWGAGQEEVLAAVEADMGNVHAACAWTATQGHVRRLSEVAHALGRFHYQRHGSYQVGEVIFRELARALAVAVGPPVPATASAQRAMVRLLGWQATFCAQVGDLSKSARLLRECLALLDGPTLANEDTRSERAHVAWQSGYLLLYSDPETARQHFLQSVELYRQVGDNFGLAHAQLGLGRAARQAHAFEEARQALTSSLALHRKLGNRRGESETLTTLGGLLTRQGRFEEGESLIQESLSITPEIDRYGTAFGLAFLGAIRFAGGRFAEAVAPFRECIAIHRDLGMRHFGLHYEFSLGEVYLHAGNYAAARAQAQRVVSQARELKYDRGMNLGLLLLSYLALVEGAFARATQHLEESPDPAHLDTTASREFGQLAVLGLATLGLGQLAEAREHLVATLDWARQAQRFPELLTCLCGLAFLAAQEGEAERAVELYALAARYPFVANSRWFEDAIGWHIAVAADSLPPDVVQAARERGQARDLDVTVAAWLEA
jgi:predicted ATPase/DNA-binding CsgD family transcriptional regulator/tetratricopeptide (TPR) repeat protein